MAKVKRLKKCTCCGEDKELKEFYKSNSIMYKNDEKLPICKDCVFNIYEDNLQHYKDEEKSLYKTLFSLDIYFDIKLCKRSVIECYGTDKHILKYYMSNINLTQYKGKTSRESTAYNIWDIEVDDFGKFEIEDISLKTPTLITKEIIDRWGMGKSNEDYLYLEDLYNTMIKTYDTSNPVSVETYKQIVLNYLDVKRLREAKVIDNKKIGEILKINSMLQADCRIKDVQATNDDDNMYWSMFIEEIEMTEPIPKAEKEFSDVDNIRKYIKRWFVDNFAKSRKLKEKSGDE